MSNSLRLPNAQNVTSAPVNGSRPMAPSLHSSDKELIYAWLWMKLGSLAPTADEIRAIAGGAMPDDRAQRIASAAAATTMTMRQRLTEMSGAHQVSRRQEMHWPRSNLL